MIEQLHSASPLAAGGFFLLANVVIFAASVWLCWWLGRLFGAHRLFDRWEPLRRMEVLAAIACMALNAAVSLVGWWLWTLGAIRLREGGPISWVLDTLVMVLFMDLAMYVFHRLAHWHWIYQLVHRFHHRHETTNPISLFVLHPVEVIGFGSLMIVFLLLYPITVQGLVAYLTLNVLFGTLGHSGVEPFPRWMQRSAWLNWVGTSTFHAEHHEHQGYNYGFYTLIWDRLFGTLDPEYATRFAGQKSNTER
ncbi:MAG: sterol desaturase family protein [Chthoniobacteraceae bacterium]